MANADLPLGAVGGDIHMPMHDRIVIRDVLAHFHDVATGIEDIRNVYADLIRGRSEERKPLFT